MLQDLLTYSLKGLACWADFARRQGVEVAQEVYSLLNAATFATLTNVNFDDDRFKVCGGLAGDRPARIQSTLPLLPETSCAALVCALPCVSASAPVPPVPHPTRSELLCFSSSA